jgi:hypothetical protein
MIWLSASPEYRRMRRGSSGAELLVLVRTVTLRRARPRERRAINEASTTWATTKVAPRPRCGISRTCPRPPLACPSQIATTPTVRGPGRTRAAQPGPGVAGPRRRGTSAHRRWSRRQRFSDATAHVPQLDAGSSSSRPDQLQSGGRVVALDSRQDMFTRRRMPMLRLQMGEQRVREVVGVVTRERLLAARAAQSESVHDTSLVALRPVDLLFDRTAARCT